MLEKAPENHILFQNFIFYATGAFLAGFLNYLFHFLVSRQVSVIAYGELQVLISLSVVFGFASQAITYFVVKFVAVFRKNNDLKANFQFLKKTENSIWKASLAGFIFFFLISPWIFNIFKLSDYYGLIFIFFSAIFTSLAVVYGANLSAFEDFFHFGVGSVLSAGIKLILGLLLALFFAKASIIALSFCLASLSSFIFWKMAVRKKIGKPKLGDGKDWKEKYFPQENIGRNIWIIACFSFLVVLFQNADILFSKIFISPEMAGHFGALSTFSKTLFWLNMSVVSVALPRIFHFNDSEKNQQKTMFFSYLTITILSLGVFVFSWLFPEMLMGFIFGDKFTLYAFLLPWFILNIFLLSILMLEINWSFSRNDFRVSWIILIILVLMLILVSIFNSSLKSLVESLTIVLVFGFSLIFGFNHIFLGKQLIAETKL